MHTSARSVRELLHRLALDPTSLLSVFPLDVRTLLSEFFRLRRCGRVANPAALVLARTVLDWPQNLPVMLHFDCDDHLLLPLPYDHEVRVYDQQGQFIRKVGALYSDHEHPDACVADSRGRVFVSEGGTRCVHVFNADGRFERAIGMGEAPSVDGLDLSGDESILYVASAHSSIVKSYCTDTGAFLRDIGAGHVKEPTGVAVLSTGHIAVSSSVYDGKVHIFAADGAVVRSFGGGELMYPRQIAVDQGDNLYVVNANANNIVVFSADGRVIGRFGCNRVTDGLYGYPWGVAIDSTGNVAVSEFAGRRVRLYKSACP
jgi:sugar lactone lactonase YvrE